MSSGGAAETNGPSSAPGRPRGDGQGRERGRGRGRGNQTGSRGGKSQRGRGRGQAQGGAAQQQQPATKGAGDDSSAPSAQTKKLIGTTTPAAGGEADGDDVEAEVCFICASPVVHQSVAPCNHRTCHICSLRMRALYKNKECAHCRTASQYVIFTDDATKRFEDYSTDAPDITSVDDNIGIRYAKEDIVGDTVLLLRYNCPDVDCDFAGLGWPDLHRHVRSTHSKKMCDLCTRNKKVFTHEHELFTDKELEKHMRNGDDRPGAVDQTGFRGHPLCAFCGSRFYDDDKLYEHCRNKHERCFLCDREDPRQPHYYMDYNALEKHFQKDHYLCSDRECQEKKFVVFASELDLKAHQLSEHGSTLSKDVRRDARLVDMAGFDFRQPYQQERRGGGSGGGGGGGDREGGRGGRGRRGRDPNAEPIPASSAQALRRDEQAFQRQMAIHSSQSVSNRTFGGQLSSSSAGPPAAAAPRGGQAGQRNGASAATSASPAPEPVPTAGMEGLSVTDPNLTPEERARLVRHASVVERASNLLQNDANKMATFRAKISAYRQDSIGPATLVESFFSLFSETSTTALGTLVREVADLFEDKGKAERLRKAWNDWRAINEDYPTLPSLSGMHGATTQSSGWAAAASSSASAAASNVPATQRHTTRVLKLKNMTQQSQRSNSQKQQSGSSSSWAASAGSTASRPPPTVSFPSLPPARASASKNTSAKGPQPSAASSSAAMSASLWGPSSHSQPSGSSNNINNNGAQTGERWRQLPGLAGGAEASDHHFGYGRGAVRRDMGGSRDTGFNWSERTGDAAEAGADAEEEADATDAKGKKKKQKKVLVQWG
ncbi:C2H2 finger domain-containing protein [Apiospora kogelbergensis]|uniref:C2H2 finger domain-containing protein n=1 Tax=Apiospora kogelbergensis TaxID=1337665 RepID=UPI0031302BE6